MTGIIHPHTLPDGSVIYMEAGIREKLQFGYAPLGWEGDPRLEVYLGPENRLHVWRWEDDGEYRLVCRSKPNTGLDERLILGLVTHDHRRGYNGAEALIAHNTKVQEEQDRLGDERLADAMEKVYWAAGKDVGHHY